MTTSVPGSAEVLPIDAEIDDVPDLSPRRRGWILFWIAITVGAYGGMETMIGPAIPFAQQRLDASGPQIAWMFTGMLLVGAVTLPLVARLAEVFDKRVVLVVALAISAVAAVVTALAPNAEVLVVSQAVQGVGTAAQPLGFAIARDTLPKKSIGGATAVMAAAGSITAGVAVLGAGPILTHLDYTFIYWIPLLIVVPGIVGIALTVPRLAPETAGGVDWLGALLIGGGFALVLVGLTESSSHRWMSFGVLGLIVAGLVVLALFVAWEQRVESPLVNLESIAQRDVALVLAVSALGGIVQFSLFSLAPVLALIPSSSGYGMGGDGWTASMVVFAFVAVSAVGQFLFAVLRKFVELRYIIVLSSAVIAAAVLLLLAVGQAPWVTYVAMGLAGGATGLTQVATINLVMERVAKPRVPSVTGALWVSRTLGGTFGSQVTAAVVAANLVAGAAYATWAGYVTTLIGLVVVLVITMFLAALLRRAKDADVAV